MSGDIIVSAPKLPSNLASAFGYQDDDLSKGASAGFPILSYRGKVWRVTHRGDTTKLTTPDGDPLPSIRVIILKANPNLSKIYYAKAYTEGDDEKPDCWSADGIKPDASVPNPVNPQCEGCPKAAWGSRRTEDGRELKACQDSRRLAVVPANDVANEVLGGPMMLRVPAASLANLATYDSRLKKANVAYFGVATKIYFDDEAAYPKLCFDFDGPNTEKLTEADAKLILELRDGDAVQRIMSSAGATAGPAPADNAEPPAKQPAKQPAKAKKAEAPAPAPEPEEAPDDDQDPAGVIQVTDEAEPSPSAEDGEPEDAKEEDVDSIVSGLLGG